MSWRSKLTHDDPRVRQLFGDPSIEVKELVARARRLFGEDAPIVWAGDPQTFQFSYVSDEAEAVLGYPTSRWVDEATFWADVVVHPEDRDDAVAYCALATAKRRDHRFEYRARAADGRFVWLHDLVSVVPGPRKIPKELRGIMFDITSEKELAGSRGANAPWPSAADLSSVSP